VYNSIVRPYFTYCCEVWDVFGETQSKRLQNRAARIIMNMSNDVDHLVALDALDWKPLKTERIKAKSKLMFKLLNNMGPKSDNSQSRSANIFKTNRQYPDENLICLLQIRGFINSN
jgi:hypothetical protein